LYESLKKGDAVGGVASVGIDAYFPPVPDSLPTNPRATLATDTVQFMAVSGCSFSSFASPQFAKLVRNLNRHVAPIPQAALKKATADLAANGREKACFRLRDSHFAFLFLHVFSLLFWLHRSSQF